jgi:hypothetical protein
MFITFFLKRLIWIALGIAVTLEIERWLQTRRPRYTPNAIAGRMLDGINRRLEQSQAKPHQA